MSIKAYVGRMGSGKTYEVVSVVILAALAMGRRVVSNIAGLNYDEFKTLLIEQGRDESEIGELVQITHAQVVEPNFWRTDQDQEKGVAAFIQPGDLVALDEVWRFWEGFGLRDGDGKKRPDRVMNFFRMHRHFSHPETGVTCDVAIICQDIMDLHRSLRAVIEETYYMEKLTAIGSAKRYRVDVFQGGKLRGRPLRSIQRSYDPRFFVLYSSHSQKKEGAADAREENIDGRGNLLKGALFKIVLPLSIPVLIFAVWTVYSFLNPKSAESSKSAKSGAAKGTVPAADGVQQSRPPRPELADDWRVVGFYTARNTTSVLLSNGVRERYLVNPPVYQIAGLGVSVELPEGGFATNYTGSGGGGLIQSGAKP